MCLVLALILFSQDDCIFIPSAITGRNIYHTGPGASKKNQIQILRALTPSRLIPFWSNSKIDLFLAPSGYQEVTISVFLSVCCLHILIVEYWCGWAVQVSPLCMWSPRLIFPRKPIIIFPRTLKAPRGFLPLTAALQAGRSLSTLHHCRACSCSGARQTLFWVPRKKASRWYTILKRKQKY